jgi:hypothetical protein
MDALIQIAGGTLILLALADVFLTVLYARSGAGFITPKLNRMTWRLLRRVAPARQPWRDRFLSFDGPSLLVLTVAVWALLLFAGAALVTWPELGRGIHATQGETATDFFTALYYGGYSLTTLGTGDIAPVTGRMKVLMVVLALVGFSFVTLTITYFMSVYSALLRRNKLAQALHHMSAGSGDAAEILARLGPEGDFGAGGNHLAGIAMDVIDLLESHHLYPVLHYFRMLHPRYAMARIALLTLDTVSLVQSALSRRHGTFAKSAAAQMLWGSGMDLLQDTAKTFLPANATDAASSDEEEDVARQRYRRALARLDEAGISTAEDPVAGEERYLELREHWIDLVRAFAELGGYEWREISALGNPTESVWNAESAAAISR